MMESKNQKGLFQSLAQFMDGCKGKMVFSVIFAVVGVSCGILPYVGATHIVNGLFEGNQSFRYYLVWGLAVAGGGALAKIVFMLASTALVLPPYTDTKPRVIK